MLWLCLVMEIWLLQCPFTISALPAWQCQLLSVQVPRYNTEIFTTQLCFCCSYTARWQRPELWLCRILYCNTSGWHFWHSTWFTAPADSTPELPPWAEFSWYYFPLSACCDFSWKISTMQSLSQSSSLPCFSLRPSDIVGCWGYWSLSAEPPPDLIPSSQNIRWNWRKALYFSECTAVISLCPYEVLTGLEKSVSLPFPTCIQIISRYILSYKNNFQLLGKWIY